MLRCTVWIGLGLLLGCHKDAPPEAEAQDLLEAAAERGLSYQNRSGGPEKATILEANGAGVAVIDLGNDGDEDLVFSQGLSSLAEFAAGQGADLEIYENDGRGHFRRVAGPGLSGWWTGLAVGDLDSDGDQDLVAAGLGVIQVLLQDQGRLQAAMSARSPAGSAPAWPTSMALFDANGDGHLDLYVGQYLDFDPARPPLEKLGSGALAIPCRWKGQTVFCGPRGLNPQLDRLLQGDGRGNFQDRSAQWLVDQRPGYALAVAAFDADNDGDSDVFVAHDSAPNVLWIQERAADGAPRFVDYALAADVALSADGMAQAGMGIAAGDANADGKLDLAVTNFSDEATELYLGAEQGFTRMTHRMALAKQTRSLLSWSVHLVDFDGDGWLELFTTNGHVYPQADAPNTGTRYAQEPSLFRLFPARSAERMTPRAPRSLLGEVLGARGSAVADFDLDGRVDVVVARIDGPAGLGLNRYARERARLSLRLLGSGERGPSTRATPRDGHGACAEVLVGERKLYAEVQNSVGYQSSSTLWLHFGLDQAQSYSAIRIRWPSGRVEELPAGPANRRLWIEEGRGITRTETWR